MSVHSNVLTLFLLNLLGTWKSSSLAVATHRKQEKMKRNLKAFSFMIMAQRFPHSLSVILLTKYQQTDLRVAKSIDHKEIAVFVVKTNFLANLVRQLKCAHRVQDPIEVLRLSRKTFVDGHCDCIVKFDVPSDLNHYENLMAVDGSSCKPPILFPP